MKCLHPFSVAFSLWSGGGVVNHIFFNPNCIKYYTVLVTCGKSLMTCISFVYICLEAFCALKIAAEKFLSVSKSRILLLKLQLLHERALHR